MLYCTRLHVHTKYDITCALYSIGLSSDNVLDVEENIHIFQSQNYKPQFKSKVNYGNFKTCV